MEDSIKIISYISKYDQPLNVDIILKEFKQELKSLYGERLNDIILYGSYARGEATKESDIDVMIILKGSVTPGKEIDKMIDVITDINLKYETLISVFPVSNEDYLNVKSPILINVRREGITV